MVTTSMPVSTKVVGTAGPGAAHPPPPLSPPVEAVPKNPFPHFNSNLHVSVLVAKKKRCEEVRKCFFELFVPGSVCSLGDR